MFRRILSLLIGFPLGIVWSRLRYPIGSPSGSDPRFCYRPRRQHSRLSSPFYIYLDITSLSVSSWWISHVGSAKADGGRRLVRKGGGRRVGKRKRIASRVSGSRPFHRQARAWRSPAANVARPR